MLDVLCEKADHGRVAVCGLTPARDEHDDPEEERARIVTFVWVMVVFTEDREVRVTMAKVPAWHCKFCSRQQDEARCYN